MLKSSKNPIKLSLFKILINNANLKYLHTTCRLQRSSDETFTPVLFPLKYQLVRQETDLVPVAFFSLIAFGLSLCGWLGPRKGLKNLCVPREQFPGVQVNRGLFRCGTGFFKMLSFLVLDSLFCKFKVELCWWHFYNKSYQFSCYCSCLFNYRIKLCFRNICYSFKKAFSSIPCSFVYHEPSATPQTLLLVIYSVKALCNCRHKLVAFMQANLLNCLIRCMCAVILLDGPTVRIMFIFLQTTYL